MAEWPITDVARMSKVSARTLRHYDDIGLLRPARTGRNGYRYYEQEQLIRLQQILLLRELGLALDTIAEVLDGQRDQVETLRRHHGWLVAERDRLARLADTVSRTISRLTEGDDMPAEELFEGFAERQARFETDLVDRYGEGVRKHFADSREHTKGWGERDYLAARDEMDALDARFVELLRSGVAVDDPRVFAVLDDHHAAVARFWTPDRSSYAGLGQLYVEHPEFRARYDAKDPGLAEYLRDAMAAYAAARLD